MYKRQNFCGWCHGLGHNKRTCVKYRAYLESKAKNEAQRGIKRATGYWQTLHSKTTGKWLDGTKVIKRPSKKRKCSFCHEHGHNSRGCKTKKKQLETLGKLNNRWKKGLSVLLNMGGFGKGSLLKTTRTYSGQTTRLIALGLDLGGLWAGSNAEAQLVVNNPATGQTYATYFPRGPFKALRSQIEWKSTEQWHRSFNHMLRSYGQSSIEVTVASEGSLPIITDINSRHLERLLMDEHTLAAITGRVEYLESIVSQLARKGL